MLALEEGNSHPGDVRSDIGIGASVVDDQAEAIRKQQVVQLIVDLMILFVEQLIVGGVVSTTVTIWLQMLLLLQPSLICQVWVITFGQLPFVARPSEAMVMLVPQQNKPSADQNSSWCRRRRFC